MQDIILKAVPEFAFHVSHFFTHDYSGLAVWPLMLIKLVIVLLKELIVRLSKKKKELIVPSHEYITF